MLVSLLTVTGGASLAGAWVAKRWGNETPRRGKDPGQAWWRAPWQTVQETLQQARQRLAQGASLAQAPVVADAPLALAERTDDPNVAIHYGWRAATLALGATTTGLLVSPSLQIVGLPLLVYMGVPQAQAAYDQLWVNGRPSRALAETVVLAVCLTSGSYWVGSLGFWLYYGGQRLLAGQQPSAEAPQQTAVAPITTHVWQAGFTCAVPTATLQPGDQMILHSGELAPLDGVITEGVAWLRPQALSAAAGGLRKAVGDKVTANDIVVVGRICVRVLPTAQGRD